MIALASLASLGAGAGLAAFAPRAGMRAHACESWNGLLLIAGLAPLGSGLPPFRSAIDGTAWTTIRPGDGAVGGGSADAIAEDGPRSEKKTRL